jgi:hypothetical protein
MFCISMVRLLSANHPVAALPGAGPNASKKATRAGRVAANAACDASSLVPSQTASSLPLTGRASCAGVRSRTFDTRSEDRPSNAEFYVHADCSDWATLQKALADYICLRDRTHGGGPIATIEARRRVA